MPTQATDSQLELDPTPRLPEVEPIPLTPRADPFDDAAWVFEPKYDGIRTLVYASGGAAQLRASQNLRLSRLSELCERIAGVLQQREVILDGEVVSLDRQGKPSFRDLIRGDGFLAFAAFDLLWLNGKDLRGLALAERKRLLAELLPEDTGPLYKILTLDEYGRALFGAIRKMELAGVLAKRRGDPYRPDVSWLYISNAAYSQGDRRRDPLRRREPSRTR